MSNVNASDVKILREKTGAGMMDCKKALAEANGNFEAAIENLRKKGLKDLAKRADKVAAEGVVDVYVHPGNQVAVIVELNCETDFVARGKEFSDLARGVAMHIAAMKPAYTVESEVPAEIIEKEKEILKATLTEKQQEMADKILPGKLAKFYEENVLMKQMYIRDESGKTTVEAAIQALSMQCGEKITLRRFVRMEVGEGIEKKIENLAQVVSETISGN